MKLLRIALFALAYSFAPCAHADDILKGSPASLERQNREADRHGLERIRNDTHLEICKRDGLLVKLSHVPGVSLDPRLNSKFCFVRPWTAKFLKELGHDFHERFGRNFQINSATRTIVYQRKLSRRNKNAAAITGPQRSSHLTGATIDIAKKGLSRDEVEWLRNRFRDYERRGIVEATEEHYQLVFHVMVFDRSGVEETKLVLN